MPVCPFYDYCLGRRLLLVIGEYKRYKELKSSIELLRETIAKDHNFERKMQYREVKVGLEWELRKNLFYRIKKC